MRRARQPDRAPRRRLPRLDGMQQSAKSGQISVRFLLGFLPRRRYGGHDRDTGHTLSKDTLSTSISNLQEAAALHTRTPSARRPSHTSRPRVIDHGAKGAPTTGRAHHPHNHTLAHTLHTRASSRRRGLLIGEYRAYGHGKSGSSSHVRRVPVPPDHPHTPPIAAPASRRLAPRPHTLPSRGAALCRALRALASPSAYLLPAYASDAWIGTMLLLLGVVIRARWMSISSSRDRCMSVGRSSHGGSADTCFNEVDSDA